VLKTLRGSRIALSFVLIALLLIWALINWYTAIGTIVRDYTPLPVEDYWRVVQNLSQYKSFDLRFLWAPHNEHRIVFPEIVFAGDVLWAHGCRLLPLILSCTCYFGVLVILGITLLNDESLSKSLKWAAVLLVAVIMGWKGNVFVLAEPFLLQWTLAQFSVVVALACLTRVRRNRSGFVSSAIIAGIVATYSSANGMLVWPLLICACFMLRLKKQQIATVAIAGSLAIGFYFIDYHPPERLHLANFVLHPLYSLEFIGAYLGMPFGGMKAPRFGAYLGLVAMCLTMLFFGTAVRRGFSRASVVIVLFGSYAFCLFTAILTAAGRMDPKDIHYSGAEAARYITLPLVSWAVFAAAAIWTSARWSRGVFSPWIVAVILSLLLLIGLPKLRWWFRDHQEQFAERQFATLAVENGVTDNNVLAMLFPDPSFVKRYLPVLRAEHLSIYSKANENLLGEPLSSSGRIVSTAVSGRITYTFPVENGLELAGLRSSRGSRILLANERHQIAGFGGSLDAGWPACIPPPGSPGSSLWLGFANLSVASASISAYEATPAGLIPLGSPVAVPAIRPVDQSETGAEIPSLAWRTDPPHLSDRMPLTFIINPPGPVYSTWQGNDAAQGDIQSSSFAVPPNRCIVVPVLTGPITQGLSASVLNDVTAQIIVTVPMQERSRWWTFWRIPVPQIARVRVLAQDRGSTWGQWLAIATPRECQ
jgi:hypothetical protein